MFNFKNLFSFIVSFTPFVKLVKLVSKMRFKQMEHQFPFETFCHNEFSMRALLSSSELHVLVLKGYPFIYCHVTGLAPMKGMT